MNAVNNAARWNQLRIFSVQVASGSNRLYANGHQQVKLTLKLMAEDDYGTPVSLSREELSTLRLIDYHGGNEIPYFNSNYPPVLTPGVNPLWHSTIRRNEMFEYYPSSSGASSQGVTGMSLNSVASDESTYYDFYVRSVADTVLRVAAKITRGDGKVFTSAANKDGSITLVPVDVPSYGPEDYVIAPVTFNPNNAVTYDYIPLVLNPAMGAVEFRLFSVDGYRGPARYTKTVGKGIGVFTGFALPGSALIVYGSSTGSIAPKSLEPGYVHPGRPVIVVVRASNVDSTAVPTPKKSVVVRAVDMYGNPHTLTLLFKEHEGTSKELLFY